MLEQRADSNPNLFGNYATTIVAAPMSDSLISFELTFELLRKKILQLLQYKKKP